MRPSIAILWCTATLAAAASHGWSARSPHAHTHTHSHRHQRRVADAVPASSPSPVPVELSTELAASSTTTRELVEAEATSAPGWRQILRRNVEIMLQSSTGIRTEEEIKQLDMLSWNTQVTTACVTAINETYPTTSPNDPGVVVCYNIPVLLLEGTTKMFAADFRVFRIAETSGEWEKLNGEEFDVSITYPTGGAGIEPRDVSLSEKAATDKVMENVGYKLMDNQQYVGSFEPTAFKEEVDDRKLQAMLTPNVTLVATTDSNEQIRSPISLDGTKFIIGVFSNQTKLSDSEQAEELETEFVLPGTRIEITPAGLYLVSAYTALSLGIVGWGTWERAKYRSQYRTRMASAGPFHR